MNMWDTILDARLVEIYDIDEASLKTNRSGRMTDKQRQRLQTLRWQRIRRYGMTAIVALILWLASGFFSTGGVFGLVVNFIRIILLLVVLTQIGRIVSHHRRTNREISDGRVLMYPGRLNKVVWYGTRIMYCERGTFYKLSDAEWDAFDDYGRYRVFCTPYTKTIVGAQPVHRDEPLPEAWA